MIDVFSPLMVFAKENIRYQEERRKKELRKKDISNAINTLNGKFSD